MPASHANAPGQRRIPPYGGLRGNIMRAPSRRAAFLDATGVPVRCVTLTPADIKKWPQA